MRTKLKGLHRSSENLLCYPALPELQLPAGRHGVKTRKRKKALQKPETRGKPRAARGCVMVWPFPKGQVCVCVCVCVKLVTTEDLLNSTGNSTQYSVMDQMRKKP